MFEGSGSQDAGSLLPGGKVYVVLDQVNKEEEKERGQLQFGLKVVNQNGKEIGAGTKALLVTEKSVGLLSIQAWYSLLDNLGEINDQSVGILKGLQVRPVFDTKANNIDDWLNKKPEGSGGNLKNTVMWKTTSSTRIQGISINVIARWQSWCGKESGNGDGKKLKLGNQADANIVTGYQEANKDIELKVGSIRNATNDDKWALVPIGAPIMKINLTEKSLNNETIEGTLEWINNYLIILYFLYVKKQRNWLYRLRHLGKLLSFY